MNFTIILSFHLNFYYHSRETRTSEINQINQIIHDNENDNNLTMGDIEHE